MISTKKQGNKVFPINTRGIKSQRRPEFLRKMIMFSFVGTNPQVAKVDTVVKIEKVRVDISLARRTSLAVLTKLTYTRSNIEPAMFVTRW